MKRGDRMSQDAYYLESWLLRDENYGSIINLWGKFQRRHKDWKDNRFNSAAYEIFVKSEKVTW